MRENEIERKLCSEAKKRDGLCEKWNAGTAGWPDRIILLPDGKVAFAELKAPGKMPRPLQTARRKALMKRYDSVDAMRQASLEELAQTPSMDLRAAQNLYDYLHDTNTVLQTQENAVQ